jgi:hypothetical protein
MSTHISIPHAARLLGISQASGFRWAAAGKLGPLKAGWPAKVSIEAVERHTGPKTPEQIARARHPHNGPRLHEQEVGHDDQT